MEIIISGRHFEVDSGLKAYTEDRMQKLAEEYGKLTTARVVFHMERSWHVAEAHVNGKHLNLDARVQSRDMTVSVDGVFDKLEKQLRRHLEKMQMHRGSRSLDEIQDSEEADDVDDELEEELAEE